MTNQRGKPRSSGRGEVTPISALPPMAPDRTAAARKARTASSHLARSLATRERLMLGDACIDLAAMLFGIGRTALLGPRKTRQLSLVRFAICGVLAECTDLSISEIGVLLCRDHTTILSAIKRFEECCAIDDAYRSRAGELRAGLEAIRSDMGSAAAHLALSRRRQLIVSLRATGAALAELDPALGRAVLSVLDGETAGQGGQSAIPNSAAGHRPGPDKPDGGPASNPPPFRLT